MKPNNRDGALPSYLHAIASAMFIVLLFESFVFAHSFSNAPGKTSNEKPKWVATDEVLPPDYYRQVYDASDDKSGGPQPLPWDVGGPQPTVIRQAKSGSFAGKTVLDCGCGLGENARFLAGDVGRAASVAGFDISESAVRRAREGTDASLSNVVSFRVASCTDLPAAFRRETFDVAVDSACLHCLSDADAIAYAESLRELVTERLYVGCFSDANGAEGWSNPRRLGRDDLERYFPDEDWDVRSIEDLWWSRPGSRGSRQGGFCPGLWMEAVRRR